MPGFNIGEGNVSGKSNVAETRRKHRFAMTTLGGVLGANELAYLQKAQRPNFKFDKPDMHHNQEVAYFAGKQTWEPISISFYDVEQSPDVSARLREWIRIVEPNFASLESPNVNVPSEYKKDATIEMLNGNGEPTETWKLLGAWPESTNWGELDYTQSEIAMIDVSIAYDRASIDTVGTPKEGG